MDFRTLHTSTGRRIEIDIDDPVISAHWKDERNYADTITRKINDGVYDLFRGRTDLTVLDLGANIGLFSLYASDQRRVVAIEPMPEFYTILKHLTAGYRNIETANVAVGTDDSDTIFYTHLTTNATMCGMYFKTVEGVAGKQIVVDALTLPTILATHQLNHVDICKCNIEGSEMMVITDNVLKEVKSIIAEWHVDVHGGDNVELRRNILEMATRFENVGYRLRLGHGDWSFIASNA